MDADNDTHNPAFLGLGELEAMENNWRTGQLQALTGRLLGFVEKHRDTIIQMAGGQSAASALLQATRRLIQETGSIDPAAESQEQIREIEKERWYRAEKGNLHGTAVPFDWIAAYAAAWRCWKDKEYLYVVGRCEAEILKRLNCSRPIVPPPRDEKLDPSAVSCAPPAQR